MKLRFALMLLAGLLSVGLTGCGEVPTKPASDEATSPTGSDEAVSTEPTPPEVIAAIKKLRGKVEVDGNKAVVTVSLSDTKVTDAGLAHLKGLTNLERLNLSFSNITDAGLEHLKGLTNLEHLYLNDTKVTDACVKKLQQALSKCRIRH